jgi:selenocysteine lyase/cysteine desulfurase
MAQPGHAMITRRGLVEGAMLAGAAPAVLSREIAACDAAAPPPRDLFNTDPEQHWAELRPQWLLPADRINLNSGALGCTPLPVLRATIDHLVSAEAFREPDLPWFGYAENARIRSTREALAAFLNCKLDELALTRNATEGNNVVCNGLDMTLWVNTASEDWRNFDLKAYRFSNFGTSNLSVIVGVKAALDFYQAIGPERIYLRIHQLGRKVRDRLREYPQIRVLNASADAFHAGLISFGAVQGDLSGVAAECDARRIRIRYWPDEKRIRVSTHIFTQETELNAFFDAVDRGLRG